MLKKLLFEEPESGPDAIYGKYLFDPKRKDIPEDEKEKETDEEVDLYDAFDYYVDRNDKEKLSAAAPKLLKLIQNGKYLPLLDPGNREVYRLIIISGDENANRFIPGVSKIKENEAVTFGPGTHFSFKFNITGWTTDKDLLYSVNTYSNRDENQYFILLFAHISDNPNKFFGNPKKLSAIFNRPEEFETIGFGKINYKKAVVVKKLSKKEISNLPKDKQKSHFVSGVDILTNHNQTLKEEPESGSNAIFGKYLFDPKRDDILEIEKENQTEEEEELDTSFYYYISQNNKTMLSRRASLLLKLIKNGKYKPILDPGDQEIYRLLVISGDQEADNMIPGISKIEENKIVIFGPGKHKPLDSNISGWTTNKNLLYAPEHGLWNKNNYFILLQSNTGNNKEKFFGNPDILSSLFYKPQEFETIGYGLIDYEKAIVVKKLAMQAIKKLPKDKQAVHLISGVDILANNNKSLNEEPEKLSDPFGRYAFDDNREDLSDDEKEKHTPFEVTSLGAIKTYIEDNDKSTLERIAPRILKMVQDGLYEPILAPDTTLAYRIMNVKEKVAKSIIANPLRNFIGFVKDFVYEPTMGNMISGWTADIDMISSFSGLGTGEVVLLFKANIKKNADKFFGKPGVLAKAVGAGEEYEEEKEIISFGNVICDTVVWVKEHDKDRSFFDSDEAISEAIYYMKELN